MLIFGAPDYNHKLSTVHLMLVARGLGHGIPSVFGTWVRCTGIYLVFIIICDLLIALNVIYLVSCLYHSICQFEHFSIGF